MDNTNTRLKKFIEKYHIETRIVNGNECLVMYKAVRWDFGSWYYRDRPEYDMGAYKPGTVVKCNKYDRSTHMDCGEGLHVGSLRFANSFRRAFCDPVNRMRIVEVLVYPRDVVCVPSASLIMRNEGKVRCKKLIVLRTIPRKR